MAKWHVKQRGTESTNQALSKAAMKGTAMLITVSITFIILTGPTAVSFMINPINKHPTEEVVMNLLQYLNHTINGVLYCIVGTRFRNELFNTLCCRKTTQASRNEIIFQSKTAVYIQTP